MIQLLRSFQVFLPTFALLMLVPTISTTSLISSLNQEPSSRLLSFRQCSNLTCIDSGTSSAADASTPPRTLVLYVYHESNEWYKTNLLFLLQEAMIPERDSEAVDYILVINGQTELPLEELLDSTPAHHQGRVRLIRRPNTRYDGGGIGEVLRKDPWLASAYRFFVLMNSSVRGPFLPRYFSVTIAGPWTAVFAGLLINDVKLVGTTLSCERQIHVQSMVLATDGVDWRYCRIMGSWNAQPRGWTPSRTMSCGPFQNSIHRYNIDTMARYRGVDWRRNRNTKCNGGLNPQSERMNDGFDLDLFEVVFVKAKDFLHPRCLARYTSYFMGNDDLATNDFYSPRVQLGLQNERAVLERV